QSGSDLLQLRQAECGETSRTCMSVVRGGFSHEGFLLPRSAVREGCARCAGCTAMDRTCGACGERTQTRGVEGVRQMLRTKETDRSEALRPERIRIRNTSTVHPRAGLARIRPSAGRRRVCARSRQEVALTRTCGAATGSS